MGTYFEMPKLFPFQTSSTEIISCLFPLESNIIIAVFEFFFFPSFPFNSDGNLEPTSLVAFFAKCQGYLYLLPVFSSSQ